MSSEEVPLVGSGGSGGVVPPGRSQTESWSLQICSEMAEMALSDGCGLEIGFLELERKFAAQTGQAAWPGATPTGRGRPVLQLQMIEPPNIPLPAVTRMDIILDGLKSNNINSKNTYYFGQRSLQEGR